MCSLISGWFISVVINVDINGAQMTHFHEIGLLVIDTDLTCYVHKTKSWDVSFNIKL